MDFSLNSKKLKLINKKGEKINEVYFNNFNYFKLKFSNEKIDFDNCSYCNSSCETLNVNSNDNSNENNIIYTNFFNHYHNNFNNDNNSFNIETKLF